MPRIVYLVSDAGENPIVVVDQPTEFLLIANSAATPPEPTNDAYDPPRYDHIVARVEGDGRYRFYRLRTEEQPVGCTNSHAAQHVLYGARPEGPWFCESCLRLGIGEAGELG